MAIACREDAERIAARQVHFADENRTHELVVAIVEERDCSSMASHQIDQREYADPDDIQRVPEQAPAHVVRK
jgi:hypothetical protein